MSQAQRRLMDCLVGWAEYVQSLPSDNDVTAEEYRREADVLHDLYQQVGSVEAMSDIDVQLFVLGSITKMVMEGRK